MNFSLFAPSWMHSVRHIDEAQGGIIVQAIYSCLKPGGMDHAAPWIWTADVQKLVRINFRTLCSGCGDIPVTAEQRVYVAFVTGP